MNIELAALVFLAMLFVECYIFRNFVLQCSGCLLCGDRIKQQCRTMVDVAFKLFLFASL